MRLVVGCRRKHDDDDDEKEEECVSSHCGSVV